MKVDLTKFLGCRSSISLDDNGMQTPVICTTLPRIGYFEVHYYGVVADSLRKLLVEFNPKKDDERELIEKAIPLLFQGSDSSQKKALKLRLMNVLYGQPEDEDLF